jgi:trk/ktr system potassium uptake protein
VRVLVAGAGVWGSYIADHLVGAGHEVVMVEQDAATARRARAAGGRTVVAGDVCEPSVLDRIGLDTVDTVVAATGDDEDNLVVSLLVKRWYAVPGWSRGSTTPRTPGCSPTSGGSTPPSRPRPS